MNLYHLRVFLAVAEHEHITRAAERIFLSQPAVTRIIQQLEDDMQQKLIERRGRQIAVTRAGKVLQTYAYRIFALEREMEEELTALADIERGEITLATTSTIGTYFLPAIIAAFRQRYSCVDIHLKIQPAQAILDDLLAWNLDFGLLELDLLDLPQGLEQETLASDASILVVAPQHPWSTRSAIRMYQLCEEVLILPEAGGGQRECIEHAFARQGFSIRPLLTFPDGEALKQMAIKGIGAALLPRARVQRELASGAFVHIPVADLHIHSDVRVIWRSERQLSPAAQVFREVLRREGQRKTPG